MNITRTKLFTAVMAIVLVAAAIFTGCASATITPSAQPTVTAGLANGTTVNLLEGNILTFASNYTKGGSDGLTDWLDCYAPVPVKLDWDCTDGAQYYTVNLSKNSDMSDAVSYIAYDKYAEIEDLFMGTNYYYQIEAKYTDHVVKSQVFNFSTAYLPRTVYIDGVSNTRDIGGYNTDDGNRVKQGMVYRGGSPMSITQEGIAKANAVYGINTQIDLSGGESVKASSFGDDVTFISVSAPYYAGSTTGIQQESYRAALVTALEVFADEANYPVYIHCSLGRDRTGTLAFLLNALCGVDEMDLFMDYETAFFSWNGSEDGGRPAAKLTELQGMYDYLIAYGDGTLSENTAAFMVETLGMSEDDVNSIKSILVEEVAQ